VDPATASASTLTVPSIVESGSYSTELFVVNTGGTARNVFMTLVCPVCPPAAAAGYIVPAHGTILFSSVPDILRSGYTIPRPMGVGVLPFTANGGSTLQDIVALARTSSVVGGQGAFGVAYPGIRVTQGAPASAWISAMQQTATTRSNLAFVNLGAADSNPIGLRLEIWDGDTGAQVALVDDPRLAAIPANGFVQINAFLSSLAPGVSNAYVKVTRITGANTFLAYGVVNDGGNPGERTGDGAYVAMDVP
jgi:hypothetical protein